MPIGATRSLRAAALCGALVIAACQAATPSSLPTAPVATTPGVGATPTPLVIPSIGPDRTVPPPSPAAPPQLEHIAITLEPFANVPGGPIAITAPDDGTGRMFVATKGGKIWVIQRDGSVLPTPMLDISDLVSQAYEQGLLGIATHPAFPTDPRVFINYTDTKGDSYIASAGLDPGDADRLDPASLTKLMFVDQPFDNHNGGGVAFGPDGKLYLSFGDGGSGGSGNAQNRDRLLGKILRIEIDGDPAVGPYVIPADNPYAAGGGLGEIWHWGLRNPWRMSFDRANGDLWIGDVGQSAFEEVDVARQGTSNLNFGWNVMEGSHCFEKGTCKTDGLTFPVSEYGRDLGCTVIGGYVYRGKASPFLVGTYLSADHCQGTIFALDAASNELTPPVIVGAGPGGRISAFGEDADGELYLTTLDGHVLRIVAAER
ncbi:MAG: PQQ-dependent sugar dehydrogenase [Candidatus Limnocylindrales bacterium]